MVKLDILNVSSIYTPVYSMFTCTIITLTKWRHERLFTTVARQWLNKVRRLVSPSPSIVTKTSRLGIAIKLS